jgi:hypothetical protein
MIWICIYTYNTIIMIGDGITDLEAVHVLAMWCLAFNAFQCLTEDVHHTRK